MAAKADAMSEAVCGTALQAIASRKRVEQGCCKREPGKAFCSYVLHEVLACFFDFGARPLAPAQKA